MLGKSLVVNLDSLGRCSIAFSSVFYFMGL